MREIAAGIWQLHGFPRNLFNVYLAGDVLIDTGTRWAGSRILKQLEGRSVRLVALTHCHPDHQGSAKRICENLSVPLACHEADAPAMEGGAAMVPRNGVKWLEECVWAGPPHPVERVLRDGDEVGGFQVLHTPGHTPGHVIFFRQRDHIAIIGDLLENIDFCGGWPGLREPPGIFSVNPAANRRAISFLCGLNPAMLCFGHGPPLKGLDLPDRLAACVATPIRTALQSANP